jgi:hypothetical protein
MTFCVTINHAKYQQTFTRHPGLALISFTAYQTARFLSPSTQVLGDSVITIPTLLPKYTIIIPASLVVSSATSSVCIVPVILALPILSNPPSHQLEKLPLPVHPLQLLPKLPAIVILPMATIIVAVLLSDTIVPMVLQ